MPVRAPSLPFRLEQVDVVRVEREIQHAPTIQYVDRETVKIEEKVVYKDDPALLKQLNEALKENGYLRDDLRRKPKDPEVVTKYVDREKIVEKKHDSNLLNTLMLVMAGGIVGAAACLLIR